MQGQPDSVSRADGCLDYSALAIRRRVTNYVFALLVCAAFVIAWTLEVTSGLTSGVPTSIGFSLFVCLFVAPVGILMLWLAFDRTPILKIQEDSICVTNPNWPGQKTRIEFEEILKVESDWEPGTSHAWIVFHVAPECFTREKARRAWIKRSSGKLYLDVLNSDCRPDVAAENLSRAIGLEQTGGAG